MKITDVRTDIVHIDFRNCIVVRVETDAGVTGISEAVMKRKTLTIEQSIRQLRSYLIGKDPTDIEDHWEKMYRDSFWVGGPMHCTAISAVDCALWDILGQSCGVPVYKLMGGPTRRRVPVYCHCPGGATPDEFAANVISCKKKGFHALKTTLPVFYGAGGNGNVNYSGTRGHIDRHQKETEYLNPDVFSRIREFFIAAREAGGPELGIAVDCHGRLNVKNAIRLCRALEDLNLMFVEEPVPPENVQALARVQQATSISIAAGERWATVHGVRQFLEAQAVDILQCDLVNSGGFTGMKKIAALAEAHYVGMAPHNPNGPVATMLNLQFAASVPNYYMLEIIGSDADERLWLELLNQQLPFENGYFNVPCAAGCGMVLNDNAVAAHPYVPEYGSR